MTIPTMAKKGAYHGHAIKIWPENHFKIRVVLFCNFCAEGNNAQFDK
jgi:hypothetical protein